MFAWVWLVCAGVAVLLFGAAPLLESRFRALLWASRRTQEQRFEPCTEALADQPLKIEQRVAGAQGD